MAGAYFDEWSPQSRRSSPSFQRLLWSRQITNLYDRIRCALLSLATTSSAGRVPRFAPAEFGAVAPADFWAFDSMRRGQLHQTLPLPRTNATNTAVLPYVCSTRSSANRPAHLNAESAARQKTPSPRRAHSPPRSPHHRAWSLRAG